jgi:hypothetical protein
LVLTGAALADWVPGYTGKSLKPARDTKNPTLRVLAGCP